MSKGTAEAAPADVGALFVLKEKTDRSGSTKRFDIIRLEDGDIDTALQDLKEGDYHVVDTNSLQVHRVGYKVIQTNERVR